MAARAWQEVRERTLMLLDYACFAPCCARPAEFLRRDLRAKYGFIAYCAPCWKARGAPKTNAQPVLFK